MIAHCFPHVRPKPPLSIINKTFYVVSSLASGHSRLHSKPHRVDAPDFSKKWVAMFYAGATDFRSLFGPQVYFPYINPQV